MTQTSKALIWAVMIIVAALVASAYNLSDSASFGLIAGLSGAAWGSIQSETVCGRSCLI